jgi:hypothetical protein
MNNIHKQLFENKLIDESQHKFLDAIHAKKMVSVYSELRLALYVGIMLFTGGLGYFAYQNIGELGHIISMAVIGLGIIACFYFIQKFSKPYASTEVNIKLVYFDYLLLLTALLIISLFTYFQVYFNLVELLINWTSFTSAAILFFMAYRYDNRALLSMGITAVAAAVGVSITPINWATGDWFSNSNIYIISIILGITLIGAGEFSGMKNIKKHFKFTYHNFGILVFYTAAIFGIFDSNYELLYAFFLLLSAGAASYYTWKTKEFLFFLYSNISFYIALSFLVISLFSEIRALEFILFYYFPVTCITYIVLLITKKSHFSND